MAFVLKGNNEFISSSLDMGNTMRYFYDLMLTECTKGGVTSQYEYDNAGNLLKDNKARYEYDAFNRNTKVETFNGNIQINRYDAEGLRHEMEETTVMQACPGDW